MGVTHLTSQRETDQRIFVAYSARKLECKIPVPPLFEEAIDDYVFNHRILDPGIYALLCNSVTGISEALSDLYLHRLRDLTSWLLEVLPAGVWSQPDLVNEWLEKGREG